MLNGKSVKNWEATDVSVSAPHFILNRHMDAVIIKQSPYLFYSDPYFGWTDFSEYIST